jgi:hypothetical protein
MRFESCYDLEALIALITLDEKVVGEPGKVYSTDPHVALGPNGQTFFVKGCNDPIAFKEVVGCLLGSLCGLKVPPASLCMIGQAQDVYAGVEEVPNAQRNIRPWLRDQTRIRNREDLYGVIAVDTWLVNDDRNMGNLIGSPTADARIDVFMIDFEKSRALGPNPFTSSAEVEAKKLWPTSELGALLRVARPSRCPSVILHAIKSLTEKQIRDVVLRVAAEFPLVTWHESSIELLLKRASKLDELVEAVWKAAA